MSEASTSQQKAKEKEIVDQAAALATGEEDAPSGSSGSEDEQDAAAGSSSLQAATPSTSSKKKKKKRSKAVKALNALRGGGKDAIPEDVVKIVLEKVRAEGGEAAAAADPELVRKALEQMKIKDVIQGKAGVGGRGKKDTGGHKASMAAICYTVAAELTSYRCCSSGARNPYRNWVSQTSREGIV